MTTTSHFQRDYYVGKPESAPLTYLVMGDSTAAGCGAGQLEATYPYLIAKSVSPRGYRIHVVNIAVPGATISDVCKRQLGDLSKVHPDLVTVSVGANDATHFTSKADFSRQLRQLISALEGSGAKAILMANTPDMYRVPALPLPLSIATNRFAVRQNTDLDLALIGSKIRVIDLYGRGKLDYGRDKELYAADLFHPSDKGYRLWADLFIEEAAKAFR